MKVLLDMNLPPILAVTLAESGIEAVHWSAVGSASAKDAEIFDYARSGSWIILTLDLDFGTLLAHSRTTGPSVVQIRCADITPGALATFLIRVLALFETELNAGALLSVSEDKKRIRHLPLV